MFRTKKFSYPEVFFCAVTNFPSMQGFSLLQLEPSLDIACQRLPGGITAGLNVSVAIRVAIINNAALTSCKYDPFFFFYRNFPANQLKKCLNFSGFLRGDSIISSCLTPLIVQSLCTCWFFVWSLCVYVCVNIYVSICCTVQTFLVWNIKKC